MTPLALVVMFGLSVANCKARQSEQSRNLLVLIAARALIAPGEDQEILLG